jgi:hypothetical protein
MLLVVEGLAQVVGAEGRYEEAVSLHERAYTGRKVYSGRTTRIRYGLGSIVFSCGDF